MFTSEVDEDFILKWLLGAITGSRARFEEGNYAENTKKKKKERSDVEDSAGADKGRGEIADKIQELKITKAKSKSLFTRRKNQLLDSLDDAFSSGYREIRNFRKLLDEAFERVIKDLKSLAELYSKAKDRSGLDKTSREIEDIEGEFAILMWLMVGHRAQI